MMPISAKKVYDKIPGEMLKRIKEKIYTICADLSVVIYHTQEPVSFENRMAGEKISLAMGDTWGKLFDCAWFHFTGCIPDSCKGHKTVLLLDDTLTTGATANELARLLYGAKAKKVYLLTVASVVLQKAPPESSII